MKLNIPIIRQTPKSDECLVANLTMVLRFLGDNIEYKEVIELMNPYKLKQGYDNQGAAIVALDRGYNTFFAYHDLQVISPEIENVTEKDLERIQKNYESIPNNEENLYRRRKLLGDINIIKRGGKYSTALPTLEGVDEFLQKGMPVILSVRNRGIFLRPNGGMGNHAITITGKEGDHYFFNNSQPIEEPVSIVSRDRLLHAWYNSGAYMLAIWKE